MGNASRASFGALVGRRRWGELRVARAHRARAHGARQRARAEVLADLTSWRRETREAAVVAAGRARMSEARGALESLGESVDHALVREALVRLAVG